MYTFSLTPSAIRDLEDITDYIANELDAPERAVGLLNDIETAIVNACAFPLSLPPVRDELLRLKGYRKVIVNNWFITES